MTRRVRVHVDTPTNWHGQPPEVVDAYPRVYLDFDREAAARLVNGFSQMLANSTNERITETWLATSVEIHE